VYISSTSFRSDLLPRVTLTGFFQAKSIVIEGLVVRQSGKYTSMALLNTSQKRHGLSRFKLENLRGSIDNDNLVLLRPPVGRLLEVRVSEYVDKGWPRGSKSLQLGHFAVRLDDGVSDCVKGMRTSPDRV
jgi:hypothetical protein